MLCLVAACSADDSIDITFDPCSPLTIVPSSGTSALEVQSIEAAILAWSRVIPTQIEVGAGSPEADTLAVAFESGDTFYRATYWAGVGKISISREGIAPDDYAVALAHEMGHAFGLLHVSSDVRASVMNTGNLELEPTDADALAVRDLWDTCGVSVSPTDSD
jgi:hypothetical protein